MWPRYAKAMHCLSAQRAEQQRHGTATRSNAKAQQSKAMPSKAKARPSEAKQGRFGKRELMNGERVAGEKLLNQQDGSVIRFVKKESEAAK